MNMFSTKDEVDQHVKKLLSLSKNQHDNDLQCQMIAKFYFDVKEYDISKNYINRYIKIKDNNQHALKLKAKIHENLNEFELATKEYEKLYDMFSDETDLNKACECLYKCDDINDIKVKKFLTILEKSFPNNSNYLKLKKLLSPNVSFNYTIDEIDKLKEQIKMNVNDDLKIRFLRILDNQNGVTDSLKECVQFMNMYTILDNVDVVRICLSIFKKHYKANGDSQIHYFILLISSLRNHGKICDYDRGLYLLDLLNLLNDDKLGTLKEMFGLFMFYLSSFAHCRAFQEKKLTNESIISIYGGYLISNSIEVKGSNNLGAPLLKWVTEQSSYTRSVAGHFIFDNLNLVETGFNSENVFIQLAGLVWNSTDEVSPPSKFFKDIRVPSMKIYDIISRDVHYLSQQFHNLKLIAWQMMCYNSFDNPSQYDIRPELCNFIGELVRKLFPKLPTTVAHKRCPENICKTDIIIFLIGTFLTYQKSYNKIANGNSLLYPFDLWEEIRIPEVVHKWWQAACDFTLQNKRNTSIGALRDLLKSGLDSLQLVDNQMSDVLKMQLGKLTYNCSNYIDSERDSLAARAIALFDNVLRPTKATNSFKTLAISSYSNSVSRQRSFTSLTGSFGGFKTKELFDTEHVADDIMDQWKLKAYLLIINWNLQPSTISNVDFDELEQLAESAEKLNSTWPNVHLLKSNIYLARAQSKKNVNYGPDEFHRLMKLATDSAHEGLENLHVLNDTDRVEMHDLLQQHLNNLGGVSQHTDYSIFEFSCTRESSNSNKFLNQSVLSNDFYNQSLISNEHSNFVDNFKLEQLQSEMVNIGTSQDKIGSDIGFCMSQVDMLTRDFKNKLDMIQKENGRQKQLQNDTYSSLIDKIDTLTRKTDKLEFQVKIDREEKEFLAKTVDNLIETVNKITIENSLLKNEVKEFHMASKIVNKIIHPEISKFNSAIDSNMRNIIANISKLDTMKMLLPLYCQNNQSVDSTVEEEEEDEEEEEEEEGVVIKSEVKTIDLLTYKENKWECVGCYCMNDNNTTVCPACSFDRSGAAPAPQNVGKLQLPFEVNKTSTFSFGTQPKETTKTTTNVPIIFGKPSVETKSSETSSASEVSKNTPVKFEVKAESETNKQASQPDTATINLLTYKQNKWECLGCYCMNDNTISVCPACSYQRPGTATSTTTTTQPTSKLQLPFEVSKASTFTFGSQPNASKDTNKTIPVANTANFPIVFGKPSAEPKSNDTFSFGVPKPTPPEISRTVPDTPVKFGVKTEPETNKLNTTFVFNLPKTTSSATSNISFGGSDVSKTVTNWKCKCTTINKADHIECIACGEPKSEKKTAGQSGRNGGNVENHDDDGSDSDVIFMSEPFVTEEQKMRARALMLPDHFYYFENLPDKDGEIDSESDRSAKVGNTHNSFLEKKTEPKQEKTVFGTKSAFLFNQQPIKTDSSQKPEKNFTFGLNSADSTKLSFGNFNPETAFTGSTSTFSEKKSDNEDENPEDFDPHYKAIIDLPDKIQVITGEEDSECLFKQRCRLFKFVNNAWNERGIGEMKILTCIKDGVKSSRLVMKREQVHKVCCNQAIIKNVPSFKSMNKCSVCWFAMDFSEGTELVTEQFAIKFKLEEDLNKFMDHIKALQAEM